MTEHLSVADQVGLAKRSIAQQFLHLRSRNHTLSRRSLVASLGVADIPQQVANDAIDELLQAGLLKTLDQRRADLSHPDPASLKEGDVLMGPKQLRAAFALVLAPSDALIAADGLADLLTAPVDDNGWPTVGQAAKEQAVDNSAISQAVSRGHLKSNGKKGKAAAHRPGQPNCLEPKKDRRLVVR